MFVRARLGHRLGDEGSVIWDYLFPSQSSSLIQGQAQIQSVPQNAANANAAAIAAGLPAPYDVPMIQAAANIQSGQFALDNAQIWAPDPFDPSTWPWYYWAGILGVGILVFVRK